MLYCHIAILLDRRTRADNVNSSKCSGDLRNPVDLYETAAVDLLSGLQCPSQLSALQLSIYPEDTDACRECSCRLALGRREEE